MYFSLVALRLEALEYGFLLMSQGLAERGEVPSAVGLIRLRFNPRKAPPAASFDLVTGLSGEFGEPRLGTGDAGRIGIGIAAAGCLPGLG